MTFRYTMFYIFNEGKVTRLEARRFPPFRHAVNHHDALTCEQHNHRAHHRAHIDVGQSVGLCRVADPETMSRALLDELTLPAGPCTLAVRLQTNTAATPQGVTFARLSPIKL